MAESKGFEPLWLAPNGFQDRPVMTASVTLRMTKEKIPYFFPYVNSGGEKPLPAAKK